MLSKVWDDGSYKENNQNALRATKVYAEVCGSSKCMGEYDVENLFDGDWEHKEE